MEQVSLKVFHLWCILGHPIMSPMFALIFSALSTFCIILMQFPPDIELFFTSYRCGKVLQRNRPDDWIFFILIVVSQFISNPCTGDSASDHSRPYKQTAFLLRNQTEESLYSSRSEFRHRMIPCSTIIML